MDLDQDEDSWLGLMNMGMNLRVPQNAGIFFFNYATCSYFVSQSYRYFSIAVREGQHYLTGNECSLTGIRPCSPPFLSRPSAPLSCVDTNPFTYVTLSCCRRMWQKVGLFSRTESDHGLVEVLAMRSSYSLAPPLLYHHLIPRDR